MTREKVFLSETDQYLFGQGTHYDIYKKLGAHLSCEDGKEGVFFAVWAPNAAQVHVIGSFNEWREDNYPMERIGSGGIWTLFVPGIGEGEQYKYLITAADGRKLYKADPYANQAQYRPDTASVITDISGFNWEDSRWMKERAGKDMLKEPIAIYECHIGSFMKHWDSTTAGYYNYREFADRIIEYTKEMKYTHVEFIGIAEFPYDGSWGYQVTGYYAPTSRYGTPGDFMYLINELHKAGVGVILDWVPAHFARDAHGLTEFDGTCLYEHADPRRGEHPDWGTKIFNYGRTEVKNFLIANALFWMKEFHVDGLRVDAVASMLYLNYGKENGQWCPNQYGSYENLEAIEFFRHLNSVVRGLDPGFMTIAEESTSWPHITADVDKGGLGFTFKWNMGWMHDFCQYMKLDPVYRRHHHHGLTFAMSYNDSENFILPLSHDEVVHLKCSMLGKMPGYPADKYANLKAGYTYMFGHSGKKLLFMGQDFGQEREWSEDRELDWFQLQEKHSRGLHEYVKELLKLYRNYPCMYQSDNSWDGFEWMNADDADRSTYSFIRKPVTGHFHLLFVINMTPMKWENYRINVPGEGKYQLILNSDEERFGGNGSVLAQELTAVNDPGNYGRPSLYTDVPPYGALVYKF